MSTIRIILPTHLRTLAHTDREVTIPFPDNTPLTIESLLTALESQYPMLRGTIRDHTTHTRRPMVRFYCCEEDLSHDPPTTPLPAKLATGEEAFYIIGAIAGG